MRKAELNCFSNYFLCMVLFSGIYFVLLCNHFNKSTGHILDIFHIMHLHLVLDSWNFVWKFSQDTFISIEIKYILVTLVELRRFTYCWFECCILTTHDKMISLSFLILLPVQQYFASFNGKSHSLVHWKTLASVTMCLIFSQWQAKKTVYIFIIDHGVLTFLLIL